jgi:hypothetical protein
MRMHNFLRFLIFAVVVGLPSLTHAMLIAVYTQPGDSLPLEEVRALARSIRENPGTSIDVRFIARVADSSVLSSDFSVPPGVSAYFWSDQTYGHAGFQMLGTQACFESGIPKSAEELIDTMAQTTDIAPVIVWTTAFQGASMDSKHLQLRYTLSEPGQVSVEVYGMNGRSFGRWNWQEAASGRFQRSFELNRAPPGTVLVRWSYGKVQVIRKITGIDKGSR